LKEGDQVLVKVLAVDGNRIKLSRKAILKEQRAKMGGGEAPPEGEGAEGSSGASGASGGVTFEGGHERADEPSSEPNFNRDGGYRRERSGGGRPGGGRPGGGRGGRPGGGGGRGGDRGRRGGR